ncbi:MFS transporter [Mastigocoleus testarum]|uniref:MFS transporter n=1 Tax=Mastigocoleus testarum BC008 TaxID=371196 RepID=A0A0V7ZVD9_9CYAN|nr:MFS transporter [Mastigocoleus testarum]KST68612.1 MFS transporter [Mastigocoleus testarum BC008]
MTEIIEKSPIQEGLTVLREMRTFILIWFGQIVSVTGSGLTNFALDIWVYQKTGSVTQFALLILFNTLPFVLISPIAGLLADRFSRRWLMIISELCAGLCTLTIALLYINGQLEIWHIYIATALSNAFLGIQWPTYNASVTLLVPEKHLSRANAMNQLADGFARLTAPILGATLLGIIHLKGIIVIDFSTILFAQIFLLVLPFPEIHNNSDKTQDTKESEENLFLGEVFQGFSYLRQRPGLLAILLFTIIINYLVGVFDVVVIPLALSFNSVVITGTIFSITCSGILVGGVATSIWGKWQSYIHTIFISTILAGLFILIAGLQPSLYLFTAFGFLFFLTVPVVNSSVLAILQKKVTTNIQGRVFALQGAIATTCLSLGYVSAGFLTDHIFEPLMTSQSPIAIALGQIIGTGTSRGIGLLLVMIGFLVISLTSITYLYSPLRLVEEELPDVINK